MSDPQSNIREALKVLNAYYAVIAKQIADDVMEHKEDFREEAFGQADRLMEKYARQINELGVVYGVLRWQAWMDEEKPAGREPLARDEFRCFGCGEVIEAKDAACKLCGWTWR
jgi:hypothetical protein